MSEEWNDMKLRWLAAGMFAAVVGLAAGLAVGDDDHEPRGGWLGKLAAPADITPVDNPLYAAECGSCHFAYQPGLLPERSWRKLMSNLGDHFGENAELSPEAQQLLTEYLVGNAGEQDPGKIARGLMRSIPPVEAPERITETAYFIRKHDELPPRVWRDNPKVGSMSNCSACHTGADNGDFDEDRVRIPGFGRWED